MCSHQIVTSVFTQFIGKTIWYQHLMSTTSTYVDVYIWMDCTKSNPWVSVPVSVHSRGIQLRGFLVRRSYTQSIRTSHSKYHSVEQRFLSDIAPNYTSLGGVLWQIPITGVMSQTPMWECILTQLVVLSFYCMIMQIPILPLDCSWIPVAPGDCAYRAAGIYLTLITLKIVGVLSLGLWLNVSYL